MGKFWSAVIVLLLFQVSCKENEQMVNNTTATGMEEEAEAPKMKKEFGFNLEDFDVIRDTVRRGDIFGELLTRHRVDYPKIFKVATQYKDTFDVRRLRAGRPYAILKAKDTTERAEVFIYQNDPINYTVIDFRDSVLAYKGKRKVKYVERVASGVIKTSLSEAILEQGIDYNVTNNLSDVYAWTIDFWQLQKGDKFKVLYKEKYINDSIYAGAGPIEAAWFEHSGQPFYAFAYESDSLKNVIDYYDDQANNLRRTFLRAPVKFSRISSRYNLKRRIRYYGNRIRPHRGTDYAAPVGTPILATADGVVTESTRRGGNGKYVKIRHNGTYSTQYLHMKAQKVKRGEYVKQGDVIGWIGMTGNTSGPHVCYRFWKHGKQVDPLREKLPAAEPLPEPLRPEYFSFIEPMKQKLDQMEFDPFREDLLTYNQ